MAETLNTDTKAKIEKLVEAAVATTSLRSLQKNLPWTLGYGDVFTAAKLQHKHFAHALVHVAKALGRLSNVVDALDHGRTVGFEHDRDAIADLVICAMRVANEWPGGPIDLQDAVLEKLQNKNNVRLQPDGSFK